MVDPSRSSRRGPTVQKAIASHAEHIASVIHIVDHGSLSAAARALGLPKSTLSRHLSHLEHVLGASVFVRGQRELVLTETGAQLVAEARGPLSALIDAVEKAAAQAAKPRGSVRLAAPFDFGVVVSGVVVDLLRAHPEIDVDLCLTDGVADLRRERIDMAVRVGPIRDESLVARPLGHIHGVLVASPSFVEQHQVLRTTTSPGCLAGIPCIVFTSPPFTRVWSLHAEGKDPVEVTVHPRLGVNSLPAARLAAVAGLGVARLPLYAARDEIAAGRLSVVLPGWATPSRPVHLAWPKVRHPPPRVRAVVDYFLACAREHRFDG
jgi:DNA-binding transcriptional LysR family regulator